jgi:hypothetical protein
MAEQRVLGKLLGEADVAHDTGEAGDELRLLDPEDRLDGATGGQPPSWRPIQHQSVGGCKVRDSRD